MSIVVDALADGTTDTSAAKRTARVRGRPHIASPFELTSRLLATFSEFALASDRGTSQRRPPPVPPSWRRCDGGPARAPGRSLLEEEGRGRLVDPEGRARAERAAAGGRPQGVR